MLVDPVNEETRVTKTFRGSISEISSGRMQGRIRAQTVETWQIVSKLNLTLSSMNNELDALRLEDDPCNQHAHDGGAKIQRSK